MGHARGVQGDAADQADSVMAEYVVVLIANGKDRGECVAANKTAEDADWQNGCTRK